MTQNNFEKKKIMYEGNNEVWFNRLKNLSINQFGE